MEFPQVGKNCHWTECQQLDFLPFTCQFCSHIFCKDHFPIVSHACPKCNDNIASGTEKTTTYSCSQKMCQNKTLVNMECIKCNKSYCLDHRYHDCFEVNEEQKEKELLKWEVPKQTFKEAKILVDQQVLQNLKKSKNTGLANKVQLMKIKGKAVGQGNVPTNKRQYFLVHLPLSSQSKLSEKTKGVFVNIDWSIGKIIDSIAEILRIPNSNNVANANKLRIFLYDSGHMITNSMDKCLSEFIDNKTLHNGQDIIIEYSCDEKLDNSLYR